MQRYILCSARREVDAVEGGQRLFCKLAAGGSISRDSEIDLWYFVAGFFSGVPNGKADVQPAIGRSAYMKM